MSGRNVFGAFLLGLLAGGVTALLLTPQTGEETRTLLKDKSMELRDKAQHSAEETIARAEAIVEQVTRQIKKQPEVETKQPEEPITTI